MTLIDDAKKHVHATGHREAARRAIHGSGPVGAVNRFLAVHITRAVGTMWCAYVFTALALVSLPAAIESRNPVILVQWASTTFLQLVLLSIIIVGQNVLSEAAERRANADHDTLTLLRKLNVTQLEILEKLEGESK